jgi:hypothetical protein
MNPAKSKGDGEKVEHQGTHEQDRFLRGPDEKGRWKSSALSF